MNSNPVDLPTDYDDETITPNKEHPVMVPDSLWSVGADSQLPVHDKVPVRDRLLLRTSLGSFTRSAPWLRTTPTVATLSFLSLFLGSRRWQGDAGMRCNRDSGRVFILRVDELGGGAADSPGEIPTRDVAATPAMRTILLKKELTSGPHA
jgi:hypothetical protein